MPWDLGLGRTARSIPTVRQLLDATLTRSDAGSIVPRVIPSETMFILMLVHLKAKINELEERMRE
jgi:hypothetical protein